MSQVAVGWLLLDAAVYFARTVLPGVKHSAEVLGREDASAMEIGNEAFAAM